MKKVVGTDWIEYDYPGYFSYRIVMVETPFGWFQRHEWLRDDGTVSIDHWIPSYESFSKHMKPLDESLSL